MNYSQQLHKMRNFKTHLVSETIWSITIYESCQYFFVEGRWLFSHHTSPSTFITFTIIIFALSQNISQIYDI